MKRLYVLLYALCVVLGVYGQMIENQTWQRSFKPDTATLLRNPAMGWMLYEEGASFLEAAKAYDPEVFWEEMDAVDAAAYANILYIRVLWKVMEPEEGKYAWQHNKAYQAYIRKAEARGLKLAFRIFFDNGTPDWVYEAGCKSTLDPPYSLKNDKQPYYDDPVFFAKLDNFIKAFAREYDDPARVDFIDAYGLGRWGEGHGVTLKNKANYARVIERVTGAYARHFTRVLTVYNLSRNDWAMSKPLVFDKLGFLPRRDGIGSHWFDDTERNYLQKLFPAKAFIGEGCYWFGYNSKDTTMRTKEPFLNDPRFPGMRYWTDALSVAVEDALASHANTFDLRTPFETKVWLESLPHKVQRFISRGGYRLYPDSVAVKQQGRRFCIDHFWRNNGVGVLPNNHPNWNRKYKVAFALLKPGTDQVKWLAIDELANPGHWLEGTQYSYYNFEFSVPAALKKGDYDLALGIVDTTNNNQPGIQLAVEQEAGAGAWVRIEACTVK